MNRSIMVLALSLMIFEVGCAMSFDAPRPQANFVAQTKFNGTARIEVTGAIDGEQCHVTPNIKELCVTGLRNAMQVGLGDVLAEYFGGGGAPLKAVLHVTDFSLSPAAVAANGNVAAVNMQMRWKFTLGDPSGQLVFSIAETTTGPKPIGSTEAAQDAFGALEAAVLERISTALNEAAAKAKAEPADAPAASPAS